MYRNIDVMMLSALYSDKLHINGVEKKPKS